MDAGSGVESVDLTQLEELIRLLEESQLSEIEIEEDGRKIRVQKVPVQAMAMPVVAPAPAEESPPAAEDEDALAEGIETINSPMVGTFYSAPAPGEPAFVKPGDRIDEGATVCIVEAMKLMNEVAAKTPCVIDRVLVENGQPIEFGQPLFAIQALR